jgi:thiamine kinase-like enzyme
VVCQVTTIIESMQSKTLKLPPGPIGWAGNEKFQGPWFTDCGAGPFATIQELEDWYNHKINVCIKFKQLSRWVPRFRFKRLVFTNQDIAPRNLILDSRGKVWMIDWELAGVYPPGFEQAVLEVYGQRSIEFAEMVLARLSDRHERLSRQLFRIGYGLSVAASH